MKLQTLELETKELLAARDKASEANKKYSEGLACDMQKNLNNIVRLTGMCKKALETSPKDISGLSKAVESATHSHGELTAMAARFDLVAKKRRRTK